MSGPYDDIIHLTYQKKRKPMAQIDRAAQFAPFSAVAGHNEAVDEVARWTDEQIELGEDLIGDLNEKMKVLMTEPKPTPPLTITYFKADTKKTGGYYLTVKGQIRKIDPHHQTIHLLDKTIIPLQDIINIEKKTP